MHGSFAFVGDAAVGSGLRVFRINEGISLIEEPFSPIKTLGTRSLDGAQALAVSDNLLALVHFGSDVAARGVSLINIAPLFQTTPALPIRLSTIDNSTNPNNAQVNLSSEGSGVSTKNRLNSCQGRIARRQASASANAY